MKTCTKCGLSKSAAQFPVKRSAPDGLASQCKECKSIVDREYRKANRAKALEYAAAYYQENKAELLAKNAAYRSENNEAINARRAEYRALNKQKIAASNAEYATRNRDRIRAYKNSWYERNKAYLSARSALHRSVNAESISQQRARYREENSEKIKAAQAAWRARNKGRHTAYTRARYKADHLYAVSVNARNRINQAIYQSGYAKRSKTAEILGCDYAALVAHLESQFKDGMTWENRGEWHIDHVIPLASAKTEEELLALCHYSNLQPLWAFENLSKGARIPDIHMMGSGNVRTDI